MSKVCTIRPFTPEDYEAYCAVNNAVYPEYPETPDEVRHEDAQRHAKLLWGRFLAETDGQAVGVASYGQVLGAYHPQRFRINVAVLPEREAQGIGAALYEQLLAALEPYDPISLRTEVREDAGRALRFAADRGFVEDMREQESKIDLAAFAPEQFADDLKRTEAAGIVIRTVGELKDTDPDYQHKLYDLMWALAQDIPHTVELTRAPIEEFCKRFENPNFLWDGNLIALEADRYVGTSVLWASQGTPDLFTGTTGVLREYRGRGIATALKVRALTWAKERGAPFVRTWNEVNNNAMLGINFRLGFVRLPVWIDMVKTIKEEKEASA